MTHKCIQNGTVIDHIPAGQAIPILHLLRLHCHQKQITVGLHVKSSSMGWKDLIKIEDWAASPAELSQIALFAPIATLNFIRDSRVHHKTKVAVPTFILASFLCPNPRCVTHYERIQTHFLVEEKGSHLFLRCKFCEKLFSQDFIQTHAHPERAIP